MKLIELFNSKGYDYYPTDKGTTHCYLDTYEKMFNKFIGKEINVLEIGVREGGSLRLWYDYFINAKIYGVDIINGVNVNISKDWCITNEIKDLNDKNVQYVIKDSNLIKNDDFINIPLTIAIDDGSHILNDQLFFVKTIYNQLVDGGLLIVEDIQDINNQKIDFESIGIPFEIIDLRLINNRYDDVLLLYRK